jgi:Ca-activated chloride channel family protein
LDLTQLNQFAHPEALLLLALLPTYLIWYRFYYSKRRLVIELSYDPTQLQKPRYNFAFLRYIPLILQLIGLTLAILALARPQSSYEQNQRKAEGIDIMLLLDTSASMEATDFTPNRLEAAKSHAIEFIDGRVEDRMGMVLFAQDAFSYAPLTLDYKLLKELISDINFGSVPKQGTAIGQAIAVGINRLRESEAPSRVIILLTDGANNRGQIDPITAAKLASQMDMRIYAIGIGKEEFTRYTPTGYRKFASDLDEATLKNIAAVARGQYFRATDPEGLKNIFEEISQLEKVEIRQEMYSQVNDLYPPVLLGGIICLLLGFLLMISFMYNPLEQ